MYDWLWLNHSRGNMNETHLMSNFDGLSIVMNILNETVCQVNKSFIVNILSLVYACIV